MKIKRLDLKAFGPFAGRTIAFDSGQPGLHIIFGANEAGKSSSLRALKALLYGFPERTSDNFRHANDQLLVGGCLEGAAGQELAFYRRKRRKADLLDLDGNPLPADTLAAFLHGVELSLFESLYGIDHPALVAGGRDILDQKGELGQALFAAGTGISSLKKILDSLEAEAGELYKDRGSKQAINQAIRDYQALKKSLREACVLPGVWKEHQRRLACAEARHVALEQESLRANAEVHRLTRLHRAIPELARLTNLRRQLQDLGAVVLLPSEFQERLRQVEQGIRETTLQIDKDKDRLERLRAQQAGIAVHPALLAAALSIEDLHQRLDRYRKDGKDRLKLDGMRIAHRRDAAALIEGIGGNLSLKDVDTLRSLLGKKGTIQALSSLHEAVNQRVSQADRQREEAEEELTGIAGAMARQPAGREEAGLARAVKPAQNAGDLDRQITDISREIAAGKKTCAVELARLGLWAGGLEQLSALALPLLETVRGFETAWSELDKERRQLKDNRRKAREELQAARTESREIVHGGLVPSERDLDDCRQRRQAGWRLLRRQWIDGDDIAREARDYAPGREVHSAYEVDVEQADLVADRLRWEAERVAKAAALRARIEGLEEAILEMTAEEERLSASEADLTARWLAQWQPAGIVPLSPREMLVWLADMDKLRFRLTDTVKKADEQAEKEQSRLRHRSFLTRELQSLGEGREFSGHELAPVLLVAESVLEGITGQRAAAEKLLDRQAAAARVLEKAIREQKEAETERSEWRQQWDQALSVLGRTNRLSPSEALDLLETITVCLDKLEKARDLQSRIDGIDRDVETFRADVRTLLEKTAPELLELPPEQAVLHLYGLFGRAQKDNEVVRKNREDMEALAVEMEDARKTRRSLEERLAELLAAAQGGTAADLPEAIRRSLEYQRLHEKISEAESSLAKVCEGVSVEEIQRQAADVAVDEIPGQLASLQRRLKEELGPQIIDVLKLIGEQTREMQLMDGSGQAAEAAERMEQVAAGIQHLVERYARVRLAVRVLKDEIERYREEHQDPVLRIASRLFSQLTLGSFAGLRADMDDSGSPVLVGLRPDGSRVAVEGMSDGTCDQLFLALRVATLESRLEAGEPMPFIVDDILINFDDRRSRATLEVLAELSRKNQVILFTHHRQVVDEAGRLRDEAEVVVHEL